jgi:hypothetical protein
MASNDEVLRGELEVAAQAMQSQMVLVLAEVGTGFRAEALPVGAGGDAGEVDDAALAELVGEVGVDDRALGLLCEPHERANSAPGQLEHRQGDVNPPPVAGQLVEQLLLRLDRRDRRLAEERASDVLDLLAEPLEQPGVAVQPCELETRQDEVEPLGVLVVVALGRGKAGEVAGAGCSRSGPARSPSLP